MIYECKLKCPSCSLEFTKLENIKTFNKYIVNKCQTTIVSKIEHKNANFTKEIM